MKKLLILTLFMAFLASCGSSKVVRKSKKVIKGDWTLNTISYSETGSFNVKLLNDASADCFEQSTWHFTPNNDTGTYNINKNGCTTGDRFFIFTIQATNKVTGLYDFLLKPTDVKKKSEDNHGFRLQLKQLSDTNMTWEQTISLEGKPFIIQMNFSKIITEQ